MFTGIIEEIGIVKEVKPLDSGVQLTISCSKILDDLKIGDSVAVNGACQTAIEANSSFFKVESSKETLDLTTLQNLKSGDIVNLERALKLSDRLGGHIVSGHVEGTGTFIKKIKQGISTLYYFAAPDNIARYLIHKGSVCINGISLTIASLDNNILSVAVIPSTEEFTNLKYLQPGNKINLEPDVLAKYIEKFVSGEKNTTETITVNYLEEHGFI